MKKNSKSDLRGLTENFPVYSEDSMKQVVGGLTTDEWTSFLLSYLEDTGYTYVGSDGSFNWHTNDGSYGHPYTQSQFNNSYIWYGGWVEGWGYVLPETIVYGHYNGSNNIGFN